MRGIAGLSLAGLALAPAAALAAGPTERVSLSSTGAQSFRNSYAPSLSADGRLVAFASRATQPRAARHQLLRGHLRHPALSARAR